MSAKALEKIATVGDIEQALNAVKAGNYSQVPLLSSLLLVDDLLRYVVSKGGIIDLINVMKTQLSLGKAENIPLIKSCTTALGRIAASDSRYVDDIINNGGLDCISKACATGHPEVLQACCYTLQNLAIDEKTMGKLVSAGTVKALIDFFNNLGKNQVHALQSFGAFARFGVGRQAIISAGGHRKILQAIKETKLNKDVQEYGLNALALLINSSNGNRSFKKDKKKIHNLIIYFSL